MARWIRSRWEDESEDVTFLWEVDDDGWVKRSVELHGPQRRIGAAASLQEALEARDAGIDQVRAYESQFGVVPERPIEVWDFPHQAITQPEFEREWVAARAALGAD